eukprot:1157451-Pelagomonas_calceolata.AAC.1
MIVRHGQTYVVGCCSDLPLEVVSWYEWGPEYRAQCLIHADTWDTGSSWASSSASQLSVSSRSRWGGGICLGCGGWSAAPNLKAQLFQILELFPADLGASSQLYLGWPGILSLLHAFPAERQMYKEAVNQQGMHGVAVILHV